MWAGFWNGGRKPLPPASPSQAWPYQSLTPPRGLGLLGTSPRGGDLPGRVARGSVAPRKMACRPVRGVNLAVQGHRLALEGQPSRCPSADSRRFRARRDGNGQPAFRLSSGSTYPPSTYWGLLVQRRKPLTVKRASGRALQTSISSCPTVIVPPLYGKLPELSGRWRSFQLTFMSLQPR